MNFNITNNVLAVLICLSSSFFVCLSTAPFNCLLIGINIVGSTETHSFRSTTSTQKLIKISLLINELKSICGYCLWGFIVCELDNLF